MTIKINHLRAISVVFRYTANYLYHAVNKLQFLISTAKIFMNQIQSNTETSS